MLFSYKPGERLVMQPNPHYWRADKSGQRLPYIDFLVYKFVADVNTATILFATGQCDASAVGANDYAWVAKYAKTYAFKIYERGPEASISFLWFNQNGGKTKGASRRKTLQIQVVLEQKIQAGGNAGNRPRRTD